MDDVFAQCMGEYIYGRTTIGLKSLPSPSRFKFSGLDRSWWFESVEDFLVGLDQMIHQLATGRILCGWFFHFNMTKHVHCCCRVFLLISGQRGL